MTTTFAAGQAECLIFTFKDGIMQRLAHDLKLRVAKLSLTLDGEQSVRATFDAGSVTAVCYRKDGADDPSAADADLRTIEGIARGEILQSAQHPEITFDSTRITRTDAGYTVDGALTIKGKSKDVAVAVKRDGERYLGELSIDQRDFDIKPYSAMFGTLRIQPVLKIVVEVPAA